VTVSHLSHQAERPADPASAQRSAGEVLHPGAEVIQQAAAEDPVRDQRVDQAGEDDAVDRIVMKRICSSVVPQTIESETAQNTD
jgi:hypothetical protein